MADQGISLCGRKTTCLELAYAAIFRMGWQAAAVLALLLVAAPNLVLALLNLVMSGVNHHHYQTAPSLDAMEGQQQQLVQLQMAKGRGNMPAWQMLSTSSPYAAGSVGDPHVIDLQQQQPSAGERGGMKWQLQYSPVLRMRKSAFFNQPLQMELAAPCDRSDYS